MPPIKEGMHTPGAPLRRDDSKVMADLCRQGEAAGVSPLRQLVIKAIRPKPAGPERHAVRRSLPALPVSAVGLDDPASPGSRRWPSGC